MKILQIAPAWIHTPPKNYGGTEWVISNLVKGFSDLGHDVTLFATGKSKSEGKLKYYFKKSFLEMDIPWTAGLPALLHFYEAFRLGKNYDIIHAHLSSGTDLITLPFISDLQDMGVPCVVTIHGHWPFDRFSNMDKHYMKAFKRKIHAISISNTMEKTLPKSFLNGNVIHNSLNTSLYKFKKNQGRYLTWLGKIIPDKGVHQAILAAKKTGEQIVFAGVVDKYREQSVNYFKKKVKPLIDGKQVIYLGEADLKMKNKMLGGAKGFLNPINWEEPFGMVMVESLACGTPVISFNRGAAPEIIKDGKVGYLVKDLKGMVKAIKELDKIKREDCRLYVEENFSPEVAAAKHIDYYQKLINQYIKRFYKKNLYPKSTLLSMKTLPYSR